MLKSKNSFVLLFSIILIVIGTGLNSCNSSSESSGSKSTSKVTPEVTPSITSENSNQDLTDDFANLPSPEVSPTPTFSPSPEPIKTSPLPTTETSTPKPDNSGYISVPKETENIVKPDVGNVEPDGKGGILVPNVNQLPETKKPTSKTKPDSKTNDKAREFASKNRKVSFQKALAMIPSSKDPKFQEYYQKLEKLVTKIESENPITQESVDLVNKLNQEYPTESNKFNQAMQQIIPN